MFVLMQLGGWYGLDASSALQGTNQRFVERFSLVEEKVICLPAVETATEGDRS
jgi:hypothetical protein